MKHLHSITATCKLTDMCKIFIWLIIGSPVLWACDLNHDWKVTKLNTYRDLSAFALHRMLEGALNKFPGAALVLNIKDLYGLKGQVNELGESIGETNRTTLEIKDLETRLMSGGFPSNKVYFYLPKLADNANAQIYNPEFLEKLASEAKVEYFLRVKLRRYSRLEREYKDRYKHNEHIYQKTVDHSADISYALLSTRGRYIDFIDDKQSFQERLVFQQIPDKERLLILEEGFDESQKKWISKTNYLGLDTVVPIAKYVAQSLTDSQ